MHCIPRKRLHSLPPHTPQQGFQGYQLGHSFRLPPLWHILHLWGHLRSAQGHQLLPEFSYGVVVSITTSWLDPGPVSSLTVLGDVDGPLGESLAGRIHPWLIPSWDVPTHCSLTPHVPWFFSEKWVFTRMWPWSVLASFLFNCSTRCLKAVKPDLLRTAQKAYYYLSAVYQLYSLDVGDSWN